MDATHENQPQPTTAQNDTQRLSPLFELIHAEDWAQVKSEITKHKATIHNLDSMAAAQQKLLSERSDEDSILNKLVEKRQEALLIQIIDEWCVGIQPKDIQQELLKRALQCHLLNFINNLKSIKNIYSFSLNFYFRSLLF